MMDLAEKKLALFDALLSGAGLQRVLDVAAELLGNPTFIGDMGLNVVCFSRDEGQESSVEELFSDAAEDVLDDAIMSGDMVRVYSSDKTIDGAYPTTGRRCIATRIRDHDNLLGHVVAVDALRPFTDEDRELLPTVAQTVSFAMRPRLGDGSQSVRYWGLMTGLLDKTVASEDECSRMAKLADLKVPATMILLILRPRAEQGRISPFHLRQQLLDIFPGSFGIERNGENVHVVEASVGAAHILQTLSKRVYLDCLAVGVSERFNDLLGMWSAYVQADAALEIDGSVPGSVVRYQDVMCRHLAEVAKTAGLGGCLVNPDLALLEAKDAQDGTNHVDDLAAYLACGRNVADTAKALYLHKNSMYYRLHGITKALGADLSDEETCFRLELALAMEGRMPFGIDSPAANSCDLEDVPKRHPEP